MCRFHSRRIHPFTIKSMGQGLFVVLMLPFITTSDQRRVTCLKSFRAPLYIHWPTRLNGSNCRPTVAVNTLFMSRDPGAFWLFYSNIPQQPALMFYSSNEIAYEKVHHRILLSPIHQPAGSDVLARATTSGLIMSGCLLFVCPSTAAEAFPDTGNRSLAGGLMWRH